MLISRNVCFDRSSASDPGEENVGVSDKRLSAVTLARMEQKRQIQQLLIENNFDKPQTLRTLIVKSASEGRNRRSAAGARPNDRKTSKWLNPICVRALLNGARFLRVSSLKLQRFTYILISLLLLFWLGNSLI